jgi:hypothetical protein
MVGVAIMMFFLFMIDTSAVVFFFLQVEAGWALSNICGGSAEHTRLAVEAGTFSSLLHRLVVSNALPPYMVLLHVLSSLSI